MAQHISTAARNWISYISHFMPADLPQTTCSPLTLIPQFLAGVVPLADLSTIPDRTISTGTASYLDALVLCPSIHKQQSADVPPGGIELPATAAMTSGYVFRTENQAMAKYMQRIGVVGALVTVSVAADASASQRDSEGFFAVVRHLVKHCRENDFSVMYLTLPLLTILATTLCILLHDWWAVSCLGMLVMARLANVAIIRRRAVAGWHGEKEPGVEGDLLVLMSQDRWVRLRGLVDDLKAVTSGSWLQNMTTVDWIVASSATVMVYLAGAFAVCSSLFGSVAIVALLLSSAGLLAWSNMRSKDMRMHGRIIKVVGQPKLYKRRLDMAKELIKEHGGRDDWAIGLGMIVPDHDRVEKATM